MSALDIRKKFIAAVKNRPMLYINIKNEQTKLWKEIAAELNLKANSCKIKWNSLRNQFKTFHKKFQENEEITIWYLYKEMEFLIPHIAGEKTSDLSDPSEMADDDSEDSPEANSALPPEHSNSTSTCEGQANVTPEEANKPGSSASTTNPRESKARCPQERTSSDLSLDGEILDVKSMTLEDDPKDEDQSFLNNLASDLRMLDTDSKIECQKKMQQLLQEHLRVQQESAVGTQHSQNTTN
ncbi:hypothetical protein RRG08_000117 [Elysia crispata]|uniref:MADF domain-containing protein n=1 Tax=Elysia crispata TaxID=231223 RepID=A0AAE0YW43_9GAST|nr:hypothetical protein RRG08_000117 [Elysia crispata]